MTVGRQKAVEEEERCILTLRAAKVAGKKVSSKIRMSTADAEVQKIIPENDGLHE